MRGRTAIASGYFFNYERLEWRWRLRLSRVDGTPMLVHWRQDGDAWRPHAPVLLKTNDGAVTSIKDFVHVDYLLAHTHVEALDEGE